VLPVVSLIVYWSVNWLAVADARGTLLAGSDAHVATEATRAP
jgi:hypothetical protein